MKISNILVNVKLCKATCVVGVMAAVIGIMFNEGYAAQVTSLDSEYSSGVIDVTTVIEEDNAAVYSIDVTWGGMNFSYSSGEWKPEDGGYDGISNWYVQMNTANDIKVENHSNSSVGVSMSMEVDEEKYGETSANPIQSTFREITDYSNGETLEECNYEEADEVYEEAESSGTVNAWGADNAGQTNVYSKELCFSGKLPDNFEDGSSIGVVTVTLTP